MTQQPEEEKKCNKPKKKTITTSTPNVVSPYYDSSAPVDGRLRNRMYLDELEKKYKKDS